MQKSRTGALQGLTDAGGQVATRACARGGAYAADGWIRADTAHIAWHIVVRAARASSAVEAGKAGRTDRAV